MIQAGFTGFGRNALRFFDELAQNQNREWFAAHKPRYLSEIHTPLCQLVTSAALAFQAHGIALTGEPKRSIFRINRDIRFTKDKSPYKTNAGAVFSRDGSRQGCGILYLQIGGDEGSFMALGFYAPAPPDLAALRQAIVEKPALWAKTEALLEAADLPLVTDHALTRLPKGFESHKDTPLADILRLKSLVIRRPLHRPNLFKPDLVDDILTFAQQGSPLLTFGRGAMAGPLS